MAANGSLGDYSTLALATGALQEIILSAAMSS